MYRACKKIVKMKSSTLDEYIDFKRHPPTFWHFSNLYEYVGRISTAPSDMIIFAYTQILIQPTALADYYSAIYELRLERRVKVWSLYSSLICLLLSSNPFTGGVAFLSFLVRISSAQICEN